MPRFDAVPRSASAVLDTLAVLSTRAELAAIARPDHPDDGDRRAALLLAETARALHTSWCTRSYARSRRTLPGAPTWAPRRARAEHDPAAQPAADLGLWVLEHLEH